MANNLNPDAVLFLKIEDIVWKALEMESQRLHLRLACSTLDRISSSEMS